jgi:hypothetical protein
MAVGGTRQTRVDAHQGIPMQKALIIAWIILAFMAVVVIIGKIFFEIPT